MTATHEVFNQVPPLVGHDTAADPALLAAVEREGAGWALDEIHEMGRFAGSEEAIEWGRLAERVPPELHTHDRYGRRIDEVEYVPAYPQLMSTAVQQGIHAAPWADDRPGAHVARVAKYYAWNVDAGHGCPITMTYAVVPALRLNPTLSARFEPLLTNREYDFGLRDPETKRGLIAGMSMTEKQGGSDVRANTTTATPIPGEDGAYRIVGHKWFTSAPMSDMFLTLAQTPAGVTCFLLPRVLPGGELNAIRFMRLKDKLGNKSNASSEIEYDNAIGWLVGEEGKGVKTIVEMVNQTRLDCVIGSAALMRNALVHATHYTQHRSAFGKLLTDQPLMRNVLADLSLESEGATTAMMRLAGANERAIHGNEAEAAVRRLALAATKYYVCKRAPSLAVEALECLGGNGYIEDFDMARMYHESPLMSIWEGSGNVAALDALRAIGREPESLDAFFTEAELAQGMDQRYDDALGSLKKELTQFDDIELRARRLVEQIAVLFQAGLLLREAPAAVGEAFCASRLARDWGSAFGTLPAGLDLAPIIERAAPVFADS
ncbi:MAG: acyl-CoA dehydrogenase family protein [Nocardioidaceae bacterium]|nr:acyl-CoA dehydrogenase family protein [Nocardioidaceae bacterium]